MCRATSPTTRRWLSIIPRWPKRLRKRTRSGRKRSRPPQSASVDQFSGESYSQRMSMPPMLTEAARTSRPRLSKSKNKKSVDPSRVLHVLGDHILLDGFKIVLDQEKSRGSYLYDAANGHRLIDLYGFFGSMPIGFNHPYFATWSLGATATPRTRPPSRQRSSTRIPVTSIAP